MKLTRLGRRFSLEKDSPPCSGWLAETRLGLQLMRGRYVARPHNANCFFLGNFGSAGGERAAAQSTAGAVSFASPLSAFQLPLAR
jgi:hypothetical protein